MPGPTGPRYKPREISLKNNLDNRDATLELLTNDLQMHTVNTPLRSYTTDDVSLLLQESAKPNNIILISQLKKLWVILEEVNAAICADTMSFVINNKPIFDQQKHTLIAIQNYAELCLETGNIRSMRVRESYQGKSLAINTFSSDWNALAKSVNDLISEINFDSSVDNARDALLGYSRRTKNGDPSFSNTLTRFIPRNTTFLVIVCILTLIGISTLVGLTIQEYRFVSGKDKGETTVAGSAISTDTTIRDSAQFQPNNSKSALDQLNQNSIFTYIDTKLYRGPVRYESGAMNYRGEYLLATGDSAKSFYERAELRSDDGKYRIANGKGTSCFPKSSRCYEGTFKDGLWHGKGTYYMDILGHFPGLNGKRDVFNYQTSDGFAKTQEDIRRYGAFYGYIDDNIVKGKLFNWEGLTLYSGELDYCFKPIGTSGTYYTHELGEHHSGTRISHSEFQRMFTTSTATKNRGTRVDYSNFYWFIDPIWNKVCVNQTTTK